MARNTEEHFLRTFVSHAMKHGKKSVCESATNVTLPTAVMRHSAQQRRGQLYLRHALAYSLKLRLVLTTTLVGL